MRTPLLSVLALAACAGAPAPSPIQDPPPPKPPPADEIALPDFDHGGVKATYVLSLPDGYDPTRAYPLILDFHGACHPSRKGAVITRDAAWRDFVKRVPCIVAGPNGRTTAWGTVKGGKDDVACGLRVLEAVRAKHRIDEKRIYLAGFSSGSDWLCSSGVQMKGPFAASLVTCPGPSNVVGLSDGSLLRAKAHPFLFVAGEEDIIRKDGAWQAFLALDKAGGRAMYREVPGVDHRHFDTAEYARLFAQLEMLARADGDDLEIARRALVRDDFLLASTHLKRANTPEAKKLLDAIERRGKALLAEAQSLTDPGRAYEAWWRLRTQFHRFDDLAARAQKELDALRDERLKPRGEWLDKRAGVFDRYVDWIELTARVRAIARQFPERARLHSMGESVEGRELWVLELTDRTVGAPDEKPAAYLQAALHGNEASTTMALLPFAWQLAANPSRSRAVDRLMTRFTVYLAPCVSPDAYHRFLTEPHSHWRPRFNLRPHDADGDGRVDEDGYEDLDGDGEIGQMWRASEKGEFVLKEGKLVRGEGSPKYEQVGREGIDDDGDGKFSEDPPGGVDLNRNFPVGFRSRREFEGTSGPEAASEPETRAIIRFVEAHPNVAFFLDVHNDEKCLFQWKPSVDAELYAAMARRVEAKLGYKPDPLDHEGAGLAIAWAYGARGILSALVELEPREGDFFLPAKPFKHPQLGDILLGGDDRKFSKRNPPPAAVGEIATKLSDWLREELATLPRLELRGTKIEKTAKGFVVSGRVENAGSRPLDTAMAAKVGAASPLRIDCEGATLSGTASLSAPGPFRVELAEPKGEISLAVRHPRAGVARLSIARPRRETVALRKAYAVEDGCETPDRAKTAALEKDNGPAFRLSHTADELKVAVLLGEWKDQRRSIAVAEFEKAFFADGTYTGDSATGQPVYGSVRDFYREMSHGKLKVTGRVFDWVELEGDYATYRDESFGSDILERRLLEAVEKRDGATALEGFNAIALVWAGDPVDRTSALWPMRLKLDARPGVVAFKMSELYRGQAAPIGVPCHEMGHTFGVDDKYGLGATRNPVGPFCLMAYGTHGAAPSGDQRPFHMCAWCKLVIGWVKPAVIDPSEPRTLALRPISFAPTEAFRILLKPDGSEYLLLENRRREGFHTDLPSAGLYVLRVGPNDRPDSPQTRVQLLPAHGKPPQRRGQPADLEAVAWPQPGRTELVVEGVKLSKIRLVDDVVYFEVGR